MEGTHHTHTSARTRQPVDSLSPPALLPASPRVACAAPTALVLYALGHMLVLLLIDPISYTLSLLFKLW